MFHPNPNPGPLSQNKTQSLSGATRARASLWLRAFPSGRLSRLSRRKRELNRLRVGLPAIAGGPLHSGWRWFGLAALLGLAVGGCTRAPGAPRGASAPTAPRVKFTDVTASSGLAFQQSHGGCGQYYFVEQVAAGASFFDANGDGFLDVYFSAPKPLGACTTAYSKPLRQRLYLNDGKGHFALSPRAFPTETAYGISSAVGDYNNDGHPDLYVCCYGRNTLYRNRGDGTFEDVTARAGVGFGGMSTGAVWFDYDGDGRLDLYAGRYCDWSLATDRACLSRSGKRGVCSPLLYQPIGDALFHNDGNGKFTNVTAKAGVGALKRRALGIAAADFNGDGRLDLFVANDMSPNTLYINQGQGKFTDMAMQSGVAYGLGGNAQANMGLAVGDYNDSGHLSVAVTTFTNQPKTLYRNEGSDFTDVSGTTGLFRATLPYLAFGTGFIDSRNLGRLDLFLANGHVSPNAHEENPAYNYKEPNQLLLYNGAGHFESAPGALPKDDVRVHRGAAFGDFNNDGRTDVLVTALNDRPTLLRNDTTSAGHFLTLKLTNRDGCATPVGVRCVAVVGKTRKTRVVLGGGSYGGESDARVHFGLGAAPTVNSLEIHWMSGRVQTLKNVAADQFLEVQEPS